MAKEIFVAYGVDVDAVAGWLGSYGGENSPDDISRGLFAGEVGMPRLLKLFDTQCLFGDVFVMMTAAAMSTEALRLSISASNPATRHPAVAASAIAAVAEVAGDRVWYGIGRGDSALAHDRAVSAREVGLGAEALTAEQAAEVSGGILEKEGLYPRKFGDVDYQVYVDGVLIGTTYGPRATVDPDVGSGRGIDPTLDGHL